jgi:carboxyl-terminal processing protease
VFATSIGTQAVPNKKSRSTSDRYKTLDTFAQALSYISNNYVDKVDERKMIYGAVKGMVERLDNHSSFLPPNRYERLRQDTEGEFGGVGLSLGEGPDDEASANYPIVEEVVGGSPADRAGVLVGDRVRKIDGKATAGPKVKKKARAWHTVLRGRSGTRVKVEVAASGGKVRTLTLVREQVKVPTVVSFVLDAKKRLGYIAVRKFQEATASDVSDALVSLDESMGSIKALVLDLRNNPGGLLDQAIKVCDLFLSKGTIVTIKGRRGTADEKYTASSEGTWTRFKIAVLVDQGSASAAEILAGALQDHKRATVLGLDTYGKGSVQTFLDLEDGSGLKLTTARYYTPLGRSLEGGGITPDIHVEAFEEEVIVAGSDDVGDDVDSEGADSAKDATLKDRLDNDHQLAVAYQTVRKWVGSK